MYTAKDEAQALALWKKRIRLAALPCAAAVLAAAALLVLGRMRRSDTLWMASAALTILGGGYFLFLFGVWAKPALDYLRHVRQMLNGRTRETEGVLVSVSDTPSARDGITCYALMLNLGSGEPEDDRLFYFDAEKPRPDALVGLRVRVRSNSNMIAAIQPA